ncbi:hypothetical protein CVT26_010282 [Gymnopilus dilepis]|uniref:Uncharacterized protein n=1 Tax=Gymnopilus dilepis TaxID=231916 RepID=A0A409Y151_9AGAR|nr:hypothetical protein CVT26_010282 [Gymnopilus dilepis]
MDTSTSSDSSDVVVARRWYFHGGNTISVEDEPLLFAKRVRELSAKVVKRSAAGRVKCLIFATSGRVIRGWLAPDDFTKVDVLNVSEYFPNGFVSYRITTFPVIGCRMAHDWRIFVAKIPSIAPNNLAVSGAVGHKWGGNVIFARYGNAAPDEAEWMEDVSRQSLDLLVPLLDAWITEKRSLSHSSTQLNSEIDISRRGAFNFDSEGGLQ